MLIGLFLMYAYNSAFNTIRLVVGISLTTGALFAFLAAMSNSRKPVQFAYHELHFIAILTYGFSLILFCKNLEQFLSFTTFLLIFYSVSEITFCTWLFNLRDKIDLRILLVRLFLGLLIGIGTVVSMNFPGLVLLLDGIFFVLIGINIMLYVPIMKRNNIYNEAVNPNIT